MKKILLATLAIAGLTLSSGAVLAQSLTDDLSFDGVDADGDGNVTWQEFVLVYSSVPEADFVVADLDGDGALQVAEFDSLTVATGSISPRPSLIEPLDDDAQAESLVIDPGVGE